MHRGRIVMHGLVPSRAVVRPAVPGAGSPHPSVNWLVGEWHCRHGLSTGAPGCIDNRDPLCRSDSAASLECGRALHSDDAFGPRRSSGGTRATAFSLRGGNPGRTCAATHAERAVAQMLAGRASYGLPDQVSCLVGGVGQGEVPAVREFDPGDGRGFYRRSAQAGQIQDGVVIAPRDGEPARV